MKILVACEESQAVTIELRKLGHEAYSCDIIECSGGHPEWHIMQDVLPLLGGNCEFVSMDGQRHIIDGKWDMILAFPPCTYLTVAGNRYFNVERYGENAIERIKNSQDAAEFFMKFANADCDKIAIENPVGRPKYFLLENVASMERRWVDVISEEMGVQPIMINSSLVCAAERKRLYWTNIPNFTVLADKGLVLADIVLPADEVPEKYWYKDRPFQYNGDDEKIQCTMLGSGFMRNTREVYNLNAKANTLLCDGGGGNRQKKVYQDGRCRKLTPLEYERLQNLPDHYSEGVADSHRYTAVGNGWTVDVIAHIFTGLITERGVNNGKSL